MCTVRKWNPQENIKRELSDRKVLSGFSFQCELCPLIRNISTQGNWKILSKITSDFSWREMIVR